MRRSAIMIGLVAGISMLFAGQVFADDGAEVLSAEVRKVEARALEGITPLVVGPEVPGERPVGCAVGNVNGPAFAIGSWIMSSDDYALVFDPAAGCPDCPAGIQVNAIHMMLNVQNACVMQMSVHAGEVDLTNPECPLPGPPVCMSDLYMVTLPSGGLYDIAIPIACDCLCADSTYYLGVHFASACDSVTDAVTDDLPTPCTSWNDWGSGWVDLVTDIGFPGNLLIWADAMCCTGASPTEQTTWGTIKESYR